MIEIKNRVYEALMREGISAQGDLLIVRSDLIGEVRTNDWEIVISQGGGGQVVAHSETGHHHILRAWSPPKGVLAGANPVLWRDPKAENPALRSIVEVLEGSPAEIVHLRSEHTHDLHILPPGCWVLIRQQRPTPEGWEMVTD